jgi:uncharacterized protein (TIRG00374 family)
MRKKLIQAVEFLIFLGIGGGLFWYVYRKFDFRSLNGLFDGDVHYVWLVAGIVIATLSHLSRARRWLLVIEPPGDRKWLLSSFLSVMTGYVVNLAVPRLGEIWRCNTMHHATGLPFSRLVGTVVAERVIDVVILLLFTMSAFLLQFNEIMQFVRDNSIDRNIADMLANPWLIAGVAVVVVATAVFWKKLKRLSPVRKSAAMLAGFKEGLLAIRHIRRKKEFVFHSVFIWVMYFLMLYVSFFAFDCTAGLSWVVALTTFVLGSYGMVAPVQGGLGTWHFMTIQSLVLYGVAPEPATAFAFIIHAINTLFVVVTGIPALIWAFSVRKRRT